MTTSTLRRGSHLTPPGTDPNGNQPGSTSTSEQQPDSKSGTTTTSTSASGHTPSQSRDVVLQSESAAATRLSHSTTLDSKTVLDALLAAGGEMELACELLGEAPGQPLAQEVMVKHLAEKPALLQKSLRVFAMLNSYKLLAKASKVLTSDLHNMELTDLYKAYDKLSTQLETYTRPVGTGSGPATGGVNVNILLESMPKSAADAVRQLSTLSPEQLEQLRRAQAQKRMLNIGEPEDADYESQAVA